MSPLPLIISPTHAHTHAPVVFVSKRPLLPTPVSGSSLRHVLQSQEVVRAWRLCTCREDERAVRSIGVLVADDSYSPRLILKTSRTCTPRRGGVGWVEENAHYYKYRQKHAFLFAAVDTSHTRINLLTQNVLPSDL